MESRERFYAPPPPDEVMNALSKYHTLVRHILFSRGVSTESDADAFLNPDFNTQVHDPFLLTDMRVAVERILQAIIKQEHIVIYTDYDCDGIPGGVLLHDFFTEIGYAQFENYIPHRHEEGYGFNAESVALFQARNATLIITVDCGITDHEAVNRAKEAGIDVIVTDHHEVGGGGVPSAYAVINPKRDNAYPFSGICGTAVAFKLVQALISVGRDRGLIHLKEGCEKWWLDLVGIATIADMVPLVDENRVFAHYGLLVLRKTRRLGLHHLLRKAGTLSKHITEDDIGFTIAPRINAASRMDDPEDAFHMLRARSDEDAGMYVAHLEKLNNERKGVVAHMTKEAKARLASLESIPPVVVLGNPQWRPSLVGLVANALAEEYERPVFVWGRDGKGVIKGSCRSGGGASVVRLMEISSDAFLGFGGHHASGGFSVDHEQIHTLADILCENFLKYMDDTDDSSSRQLHIDARITLEDITDTYVNALNQLAPFGVGNPRPLFEITNATPYAVEIFGKAKNHTKLRFRFGGSFMDGIAFFTMPDDFSVMPQTGVPLTLIAHIEDSYFMGRKEIRLRIVDVVI